MRVAGFDGHDAGPLRTSMEPEDREGFGLFAEVVSFLVSFIATTGSVQRGGVFVCAVESFFCVMRDV